MKEEIKFFNESIFSQGSFKEEKDEDGKIKYYYESVIVPFGKISRNKVKYNEARVRERGESLVGKKLFFNHKTSGNSSSDLPRGNWEQVSFTKEAMSAKAEVFNTDYNKDFIEYLKADPSPRSSLQVSGSAKQIRESASNSIYKEAFIDEFLESSVVNIPGFDMAKGGLAATLAEAFDVEALDESFSEAKIKVGSVVSYKGKRGKVNNISGDKSSADIIWFDDSTKNTSLPVSVLTLQKESVEKDSFFETLSETNFFTKLKNIREKYKK